MSGRTIAFANNWVGWQITDWLRERGELVGLVVHPAARRRLGDETIRDSGLAPDRVFDATRLREPETLAALRALEPDFGVSACFGYILRQEVIDLFPRGCVNVHSALLPYNRGANPNVWSIVDGTPAGVTLHYIDSGVDTGDIIAQERVEVEPTDTGETLYRKLEQTSVALFTRTWGDVRSGTAPRIPQDRAEGTCHRTSELAALDRIDLDRCYTARQLLDILRARTFPPYRGAYFEDSGRRVYVRVQLSSDQENST